MVVDNDSEDGTAEAVRAGFTDFAVIPLVRNRVARRVRRKLKVSALV